MIQQIHQNSLLAYDQLDTSERKRRILEVYENANRPLMDSEVARKLGFSDMNRVRPRITEMVKNKKRGEEVIISPLKECGNARDPYSKRTVRLVRMKTQSEIESEKRASMRKEEQQKLPF